MAKAFAKAKASPTPTPTIWANVQQDRIKDLQVAINTKASDNPNVAEQR